jgi:hypothetical protein
MTTMSVFGDAHQRASDFSVTGAKDDEKPSASPIAIIATLHAKINFKKTRNQHIAQTENTVVT